MIEELGRISGLLKDCTDAELVQVLKTHLAASMAEVPNLRSAADNASGKDKRFEDVEAIASVALNSIPTALTNMEDVVNVGHELNAVVGAVDLSEFALVNCPVCEGSGTRLSRPCTLCDGEGKVEAGVLEQDIEWSAYEIQECPACEGSGTRLSRPCTLCDGEGKVEAGAME